MAAINPRLVIDWPAHIATEGRARRIRCICGARYRAFKVPGCPKDLRRRFHWAKRQVTQHDGDQAWWWSRRSLLWVMHWLKATAFIDQHLWCGDVTGGGATYDAKGLLLMVYLLHFDRRYQHAGHYIGFTTDLAQRLHDHRRGHGSRLVAVIVGAGITFRLARTWDGGRKRERQIKRQGGASRLCPLCKPGMRVVAK